MNLEPVTLEAEYVRLEPLSRETHLAELREAGASASLFEWFGDDYSTRDGMAAFVEEALEAHDEGESLPFATVHRETGEAIGSTRFCTIRPGGYSVEIGWTWLTPDHQRTPANTETKYLMLRHAFEEWSCARVEFKAAAGNERSRAALNRIGATMEGIHRKRMLIHGEPTDCAYFSITDEEWPAVKESLEDKLDRPMP